MDQAMEEKTPVYKPGDHIIYRTHEQALREVQVTIRTPDILGTGKPGFWGYVVAPYIERGKGVWGYDTQIVNSDETIQEKGVPDGG